MDEEKEAKGLSNPLPLEIVVAQATDVNDNDKIPCLAYRLLNDDRFTIVDTAVLKKSEHAYYDVRKSHTERNYELAGRALTQHILCEKEDGTWIRTIIPGNWELLNMATENIVEQIPCRHIYAIQGSRYFELRPMDTEDKLWQDVLAGMEKGMAHSLEESST